MAGRCDKGNDRQSGSVGIEKVKSQCGYRHGNGWTQGIQSQRIPDERCTFSSSVNFNAGQQERKQTQRQTGDHDFFQVGIGKIGQRGPMATAKGDQQDDEA